MGGNETPSLLGDTIILHDGKELLLYGQNTQQIARVADFAPETVQKLKDNGFFSEEVIKNSSGMARRTNLMLLLSKDCPLRCVYCYVGTNVSNALMNIETANNAMRWYLDLHPQRPKVTLFGAGEPTRNIRVIKHIVEKYGNAIRWSLTTSGVMPQSFLEWLIKHNISLTFSVDGPPSIQNLQRPLKGNRSSADIVEKSMGIWKASGNPLTVRTTITNDTISRLNEIFEYFEELDVNKVHLELMYDLGRGASQKELLVTSTQAWVNAVLQALDWAKRTGKKIKVGALAYLFQPVAWKPYCGPMNGTTIVVNHMGQITACSEVDDAMNNGWPLFHIGSLKNGFALDRDRAEFLSAWHPQNMSVCQECFAKNICRGGCAHKAFARTSTLLAPDPNHCVFMREIIPQIIRRMAASLHLNKSEEKGGREK